MQHPGWLFVLRIDQVQLHEELTAVADPYREHVLPGKEPFQGRPCFVIILECTGPALGRTQHVAVGESAHGTDEPNVLQRFPPGDQVGHVHIPHVKPRQIHGMGHLPLGIAALFTNNGCLDPGSLSKSLRPPTLKSLREDIVQGLLLVVGKPHIRQPIGCLVAVKLPGGLIPDIP